MITITHDPLRYGLHAEIVMSEEDRPPYVPPPSHVPYRLDTCPCPTCVDARRLRAQA